MFEDALLNDGFEPADKKYSIQDLGDGLVLKEAFIPLIAQELDYVIAAHPELPAYGVGDDEESAVDELKRQFVLRYRFLEEDSDILGDSLRDELTTIRSLLK